MNTTKRQRTFKACRPGAVLVLIAILIPVLLGMTGLVIDAGLLMVESRRAQHAADAASMAAASDLLLGRSHSIARQTATTYVRTHNRLSAAEVTVNIPPSRGPYQGDSNYVEVIVQNPVRTYLIQVLGISPDQSVRRLAVAGMRRMGAEPGVLVLDPAARPGLTISGGATLRVNGNITVNSEGGGVDEFGVPVGNGNTGFASTTSNNGTIRATDIRVVGGVNTPSNFLNYDPNNPASPLKARALPVPDPFLYLPTPTVNNGANPTVYPAVSVSGNVTRTLYPGVYPSISISSGTVFFEPGIYIIRGGDLKITEDNVFANGAMFYMTGSDFDVHTGLPDSMDMDSKPPASGNPSFGAVTINASLKFAGLKDPNSPFHGMMFYYRRLNTRDFNIQGNSSTGNLEGTIYGKWSSMKISGQGTYGAQIIVRDLTVSGSGSLHINVGGKTLGKSNQVSLVE